MTRKAPKTKARKTSASAAKVINLPLYEEADFTSASSECDAIMKGGVTSGVVYPYAVLELAKVYRFRSLGGTSAGAIAASFAAAAEYSRSVRNDPAGFVRLQTYCNELPDILLSLFQPDPEFKGTVRLLKSFNAGGIGRIVWPLIGWSILLGIVAGSVILWLVRGMTSSDSEPWLVPTLAGMLATGLFFALLAALRIVLPLSRAKRRLAEDGFGACTGLTMKGKDSPGLTDWLHRALQDIAFGSPDAPTPLTFADLEGASPETSSHAPINLRMITTNLSMGRPHTLPGLGIQAGFRPDVWARYFPAAVMSYLRSKSATWHDLDDCLRIPQGSELPVICAVRMSLSFPVIFKAVPILTWDHESAAIKKRLGAKATDGPAEVWLTDGGLSSNFPVHLFDDPLPSRPTFAIGLDALPCLEKEAKKRALLPETAPQSMALPVKPIGNLAQFGWALLSAAKDWQDQLASGITGQRERIARIYLTDKEGGLNLGMDAETTKKLMTYGQEAGALFVKDFNFDEHRWRRLLATYKNGSEWLEKLSSEWRSGSQVWYQRYSPVAQTYKIPMKDQKLIESQMSQLTGAFSQRTPIATGFDNLPNRTGHLKTSPKF